MKPLDKKQIPQFAALCVLSAGLAGYLVMHLVAPGPVSAGTRSPATAAGPAAPAPGTPAAAPASGITAAPGAAAETADAGDAPPPSPAMHDPFAVGYVDPASLPAAALSSLSAPALPKLPLAGNSAAKAEKLAGLSTFGPMPVAAPSAPALPGSLSALPAAPLPSAGPSGLPPALAAPALPAAPAWTVTGVLQGSGGKVAILRSGEARRIVRSGDFVDGTYRVTGVSRTSVTLRHGLAVYQLVLGAAAAAPSAAAAPAMPAPAAPPVVLPRSAAALTTTLPMYHLPRAQARLAHLKRQGAPLALAAAAPLMPAEHAPAPAKVAKSISLGLRLLDGSVLAQGHNE